MNRPYRRPGDFGENMSEHNSEEDPKMELTRRQWLLRLGHSVVLTGFSGAVCEIEIQALTVTPARASADQALPPGLYLPSPDHLSHVLVADERFHSRVAGSETDYAQPRTRPLQPQFFSPDEFAVVRRLVELILGEGSTPQADHPKGKAAESASEEVAEWIDMVTFNAKAVREAARRLTPEQRTLAVRHYGAETVEGLETADPQKVCGEGLTWLAKESQVRFGKPFINLTERDQLEMLKLIGDERPEKPHENSGTRFFALLKAETIRGYYTSRRGLDELDYKGNTFHAEGPGCRGHEHS